MKIHRRSHFPVLCYRTGDESVNRKLLAHVTLAEGAHGEIAVRSPFSGGLLANVPAGTETDVDRAVALARSAQPAWASRSFSDRAAIFLRFHDLLLERQDEILDIIQIETGKARRHALEEVLDTAIVSRYYAFHARRLLRPRCRREPCILTKTWKWDRRSAWWASSCPGIIRSIWPLPMPWEH